TRLAGPGWWAGFSGSSARWTRSACWKVGRGSPSRPPHEASPGWLRVSRYGWFIEIETQRFAEHGRVRPSLLPDIVHQPPKFGILQHETRRGTDQAVDMVVCEIERCWNLHQREPFVRISDFAEAGIDKINFGVRCEGACGIPWCVTELLLPLFQCKP